MANPTPSPSSSFVVVGTRPLSLVWGTDGYLGSPYNTLIVTNITTNDIVDVIYIENGTGLRCKRIELIQGREYNITVEDDASVSSPGINTTIGLLDPLTGWVAKNIKVLSNEGSNARKEPGKRTFRCVYDTLIEGAGSIP
jgi:hypothetical protein